MIISKIQGGLGNQMFQFATSYANSSKIYLDMDFMRDLKFSSATFTKRDFELSLFPNLAYKEASPFQKKLFLSRGLFYKLLRRFYSAKVIIQQENEFIHIPQDNYIYLDGYFQSEKYFKHKRKELLPVFRFPELDAVNQKIKNSITEVTNSISLHIRRGDYLKPEVVKYHGVLPASYYHQALRILQDKINDTHVFIFSDDTTFAKDNFGKIPHVTIVEGNEKEGWKDMALMAYCRHHIIANSSFSWWGAWLSPHENGIKIAPSNWFNPDVVQFIIDDIIPEQWIKI